MTLVPRLFLVLLLSVPASAQVANVIISANARGVNYVSRVPAESDVQFNIYSFLSKSQGAQTATVDIEVPGTLVAILPPADGSAVCAGEHPIRCRITADGTANYSMENSRADFEIIAPGDLRGSFITATCTRTRIIGWVKPPLEQSHLASLPQNTSEFSNAIEVH